MKNHKLAKHTGISDWAVLQPLNFELMSSDTPQHNSLAKFLCLYLAGMSHAMMDGTVVPDDMCGEVALEASACATQLDGLVLIEVNGKVAM